MPPKHDLESEQPALPFNETGNILLDRYQRIDTIEYVEGFLAATKEEQNEAMTLIDEIGRPGGAARHLREVVIHQKKAQTGDPQAALRKLTRNYIGYAGDALRSTHELEALQATLEDVNPELILDRVISAEQPGLLAFMRDYDLALLRQTGRPDKIGYDPQKVEYRLDNPGIMVFAQLAVESWRVHQVRKRLPEATGHEAKRGQFWLERLDEVKRHYPYLRPIVHEGLDKIHGRAQAS